MAREDWLLDGGRRAAAAKRIHAAAADLLARDGYDGFSVDALAARVHCSRATIYRHVGGKADIRDAVLARSAARIVETVRAAVEGLAGPERVVTAIEVAVTQIRTDPAGRLFVDSAQGPSGSTWLTASAAVADFAGELTGLADDPRAAKWIVRLVLSLLFWPETDPRTERKLLARYVAPAFAATEDGSG